MIWYTEKYWSKIECKLKTIRFHFDITKESKEGAALLQQINGHVSQILCLDARMQENNYARESLYLDYALPTGFSHAKNWKAHLYTVLP